MQRQRISEKSEGSYCCPRVAQTLTLSKIKVTNRNRLTSVSVCINRLRENSEDNASSGQKKSEELKNMCEISCVQSGGHDLRSPEKPQYCAVILGIKLSGMPTILTIQRPFTCP